MTPARLALLLLGLLRLAGPAAADEGGYRGEVAFTAYPDLARSAELARRLLSPLAARRIRQAAERAGALIRDPPLDLARERFVLAVPPEAPPGGYGLLVFVSPWQDGALPPRWAPVLARRGLIFVSPEGAGNEADVLRRRVPLAVVAAVDVAARYKVDPRRIYVGGFSGGGRAALRAALAYPDLFRGVLLEAGSDPIGDDIPLPPRDLLERFQTGRAVYLTGARDIPNLAADGVSRRSLATWCVLDPDSETIPEAGHEPADAAALDRALAALALPAAPDPARLAACRARIAAELAGALQAVEDRLAAGDRDGARDRLEALDRHYGGLAAPESVALAGQIDRPP